MNTPDDAVHEQNPTATAQAARWFVRLEQSDATSQTFVEWQQWLNAAPEHRTAYEEIEETVLRLGCVPAKPALPAADEMDRDAYDGRQPVSEWQHIVGSVLETASSGTARRWQRLAMAASVALLVAGAGWLWVWYEHAGQFGVYTYRTSPGERRAVSLPEGSRVTLDANSMLTMRLGADERTLTLERGEAFFQVATDPERPFVVRAGSARVRALGTAFDVRMSGDRTVVAVTEGKVEFVADAPTSKIEDRSASAAGAASTIPRLTAQVAAGEGVSYVGGGNLQTLSTREAPLATAWLKGRRQYRNEPLRYVLADVDRYTGYPIRVADDATGDLRFTGTLSLENSDAWLRALSVALPVAVIQEPDGALRIAQVSDGPPN